jgi:hypothetical protein
MSATNAHPVRLVNASLALYQALLLLYPARVRQRYGAQLAQTFRDSLRAAARRGGLMGIAHVWRVTLGDLLITALAEHYEEITVMEQHSLPRAAGLAGLIGAALLLFYGAIGLLLLLSGVIHPTVFYEAWLFDARSPLYLPVTWAPTMVMPVAWVGVIVAIWALCVSLARRGGKAVWVAGGVALTGAVMCLLGSFSLIIGSWNSWYYWHTAVVAYESQVSGDQLPYLAGLDIFGRMIVGLGLLALPLIARRSDLSRRVVALLLVLGATALLPHLYIYLAGPQAILNMLSPGSRWGGGQLPWVPFSLPSPKGWFFPVVIMMADTGFALAWGICWLLLGWRWLRQERAAAPQPAPALEMSA